MLSGFFFWPWLPQTFIIKKWWDSETTLNYLPNGTKMRTKTKVLLLLLLLTNNEIFGRFEALLYIQSWEAQWWRFVSVWNIQILSRICCHRPHHLFHVNFQTDTLCQSTSVSIRSNLFLSWSQYKCQYKCQYPFRPFLVMITIHSVWLFPPFSIAPFFFLQFWSRFSLE